MFEHLFKIFGTSSHPNHNTTIVGQRRPAGAGPRCRSRALVLPDTRRWGEGQGRFAFPRSGVASRPAVDLLIRTLAPLRPGPKPSAHVAFDDKARSIFARQPG